MSLIVSNRVLLFTFPKQLESVYKKAHEAIRKDPSPSAKKERKKTTGAHKTYKTPKQTLAARKNKTEQRKKAVLARIQAELE